MAQPIEVSPVTPVIGAEISGIQLSQIDDDDFAAIRRAFLDHSVLFFRDQDMTLDQHKAFGKRFGALHVHPMARSGKGYKGIDGHPEVLIIHADEKTTRTAGDTWHSDVSCEPEPPMASILQLHTVPESGGDTLFASTYAAYDALSEPMKQLLAGLKAVHDGGPNYRDRSARQGIEGGEFPNAVHPVIRTHPETGRKAIFVNENFTSHIEGIPRDESDAILQFLYRHMAKPQFHCRFRWKPKSVAMWDNRCTLHHAMWDYFPKTRTGYRVTVEGDRPF
ncbi:MAG: TauD/TfdA dioxygenase family protein [Minwuia sp.]|uniref:TauD/TfdA dioxygenase family protein n=1 Tax=Minwuia sp. TaxID=2493630 RepID=UPI003A85A2BA